MSADHRHIIILYAYGLRSPELTLKINPKNYRYVSAHQIQHNLNQLITLLSHKILFLRVARVHTKNIII